jgi:D-alanyl-D-alanine carboxypeptidase/D-alanyl-D-alanine-endopeptidase (penicillin-binding protein 4)
MLSLTDTAYNILCVLLSGMLLLVCAEEIGAKPVPRTITKLLSQHSVPLSSVSIFVQDVREHEPLLVLNPTRPRNPASTIKLLTTFVALDVLGPAFTWVTELYTDGVVHNGRLKGDLILKGQGDPFFVTEYVWKLLHGARNRGLQHIDGDLVIDGSYFKPRPEDPANFDGQPNRTYNALAYPVLINFQSVRFTFIPNTLTKRVRIIADPWPANLDLVNNLRLVRGPCHGRQYQVKMKVQQFKGRTTVKFTGSYPSSCGKHTRNRVILTPKDMAYGVFKSLWSDLGGTLKGRFRLGQVPQYARPLYSIESRSLAELLRGINKFSNNVMTRQLFLTLAAECYGQPGTYEKGRMAIYRWLQDHDLDFPELILDNGTGLSRITRISAQNLARLLLTAYASPYMPEFVSSLPLAAMEGTMSRRFENEPLAGRLHMKTGSLNGVSAIAGYLLNRNRNMYVVVILQNYPSIHRGTGKQIEDEILRWVFEHK